MAANAGPQRLTATALPLPIVYVVDDDDMFRQSLEFLLSTAGYTVDARMTGSMLIAHLPTLTPGCVIIDLRMPDIDGFGVLAALKPRAADFPVIIVSGHGEDACAVQALRLGASDFFEKPVAVDRLLQSISLAAALMPLREAA